MSLDTTDITDIALVQMAGGLWWDPPVKPPMSGRWNQGAWFPTSEETLLTSHLAPLVTGWQLATVEASCEGPHWGRHLPNGL
jgi:hypothetical protein